MKSVSIADPPEERARLAALRSYQALDSASEQHFEDLTRIAARIAGTELATVTLVDADWQ